jgi:hypothetical protein
MKAATEAFGAIAKDCALRDAELSSFSASSTEPMTPEFDIVALSSDAVDNALRCDELAMFMRDARTRFPRANAPPAPAPAPAPAATH